MFGDPWPGAAWDANGLSEFDAFKFEPQEDITSIEVALLLAVASRGTRQSGWADRAFVSRNNPPPEWQRVCRHFRKLGRADDVVRKQAEDRR